MFLPLVVFIYSLYFSGAGLLSQPAALPVHLLGFFFYFCFFLSLQKEGDLSVCNLKARKKDLFKDIFS